MDNILQLLCVKARKHCLYDKYLFKVLIEWPTLGSRFYNYVIFTKHTFSYYSINLMCHRMKRNEAMWSLYHW